MTSTETVRCPLCGAEETRRLYQGEGFAMGRCLGCGLIRQNPRIAAREMLEGHYDGRVQDYDCFVGRPVKYKGLESWQSQPLLAYERSVSAVDAQRRREGPKGIWLDVGASTGQLLLAARNAGWQVAGVEPGRGQVETCREVHGIELIHGTLQSAAFPDRFAEVVSYRHVFEHIHDPIDELAEVRRVLDEDGFLLLEVPNYAGTRYGWGRFRSALKLSKPYWQRLNVPEHVYYYTFDTLHRLLQKTGFDPVWGCTYGKTRPSPNPLRRLYDAGRDALKLGNKLRIVARKANQPTASERR